MEAINRKRDTSVTDTAPPPSFNKNEESDSSTTAKEFGCLIEQPGPKHVDDEAFFTAEEIAAYLVAPLTVMQELVSGGSSNLGDCQRSGHRGGTDAS